MKKIYLTGIAVLLLVAGMIGSAAANTDGCVLPVGLDPTTELLAGQDIPVGDVYVWNTEDKLFVYYDVTAEGWYLTETHLHVGCGLNDIPQKNGNPIPGQFAYGDSFDVASEMKSWCQAIDKDDIEDGCTECGDSLAIAAHAVVVHVADDCIEVVSDTTVGTDSGTAVVPTYGPSVWSGLTYLGEPYIFPEDAKWIWPTALVSDPVNGEIVEFSKTFNIPGISIIETSGDMYVTCDNGYELNVNNDLIGRAQLSETFRTATALTNDIVWWYDGGDPQTCGSGPYGWQTVEKWDISGALQVGSNTLQLTGVNEADTSTECPDGEGTVETNPGGCKFSSGDEGICYTVVDQEETAWGDGDDFDGKNWATYFTYDVQCCGDTGLVNGGFETPVVSAETPGWDIFTSEQVDWVVEWFDGSTSFDGKTRPVIGLLELHESGTVVNAYEPEQYAELDTDWDGPVGTQYEGDITPGTLNGEPASVRIYQDLDTCPGEEYTLSYAWSPRTSYLSKLDVIWDGSKVTGHTGDTASWTLETQPVTASGLTTRLEFIENGTPDSYGMFLDNVSVELAV